MDVKIRVCLPHKYGRFMLFIDNNFGYEKITIVVDNIPLRHMETIGYIRDLRVIKHNRDL